MSIFGGIYLISSAMIVFVNEKKVSIISIDDVKSISKYDTMVQYPDPMPISSIKGKVLVRGGSDDVVWQFVNQLEGISPKHIKSVTFAVSKPKKVFKKFKKHFKVIEAGGGIVEKGDDILLIYRLGMWDLPKGKLKKKETQEEGSIREVEEETGVKVSLGDLVGASYHTYVRKDRRILKKTYWYRMDCLDDSDMAPQVEEDIEKVEWKSKSEAKFLLGSSYKSLKLIMKKYFKEASVKS